MSYQVMSLLFKKTRIWSQQSQVCIDRRFKVLYERESLKRYLMHNVHVMIKQETSFTVKFTVFLCENQLLSVQNESKFQNIETDFYEHLMESKVLTVCRMISTQIIRHQQDNNLIKCLWKKKLMLMWYNLILSLTRRINLI